MPWTIRTGWVFPASPVRHESNVLEKWCFSPGPAHSPPRILLARRPLRSGRAPEKAQQFGLAPSGADEPFVLGGGRWVALLNSACGEATLLALAGDQAPIPRYSPLPIADDWLPPPPAPTTPQAPRAQASASSIIGCCLERRWGGERRRGSSEAAPSSSRRLEAPPLPSLPRGIFSPEPARSLAGRPAGEIHRAPLSSEELWAGLGARGPRG